MRLSLTFKIASVVTLIMVLVTGLTITLNFLKFEQTLRAVTISRLTYIAEDVVGRIQTGLDLGLDLASMTNVRRIIEDEAASDPEIVGIDVFDDRGRVLFSTGRPSGGTVEPDLLSAYADSEDGKFELPGSERIVVGARMTNNFGADVGGVALGYSRDAFDNRLEAVLRIMARSGALIIAVTAILGLGGAALVVGRTTRGIRRVREALQQHLHSPPEPPPFKGGTSPLERDYAKAEAVLRQAAATRTASGIATADEGSR